MIAQIKNEELECIIYYFFMNAIKLSWQLSDQLKYLTNENLRG